MWVSDMFEGCVEIRSHFSDYLDDLCTPEALKSIRFHLVYCAACQEELTQWQSLQADLRGLARRRVPPHLALRLRVRMSQHLHRHYLAGLWVRLENLIKPLLIPATGGVLTAVICFCLIMGSAVAPVSNIPDVPLQILTPPRVRALAPSFYLVMGSGVAPVANTSNVSSQIFTPPRVRALAPMDFNTDDNPLVVLTQIDAEGRAKGYRLLSGQNSPELTQRLDRMIHSSLFRPATTYGLPTDGEVLLSLRRITVRG